MGDLWKKIRVWDYRAGIAVTAGIFNKKLPKDKENPEEDFLYWLREADDATPHKPKQGVEWKVREVLKNKDVRKAVKDADGEYDPEKLKGLAVCVQKSYDDYYEPFMNLANIIDGTDGPVSDVINYFYARKAGKKHDQFQVTERVKKTYDQIEEKANGGTSYESKMFSGILEIFDTDVAQAIVGSSIRDEELDSIVKKKEVKRTARYLFESKEGTIKNLITDQVVNVTYDYRMGRRLKLREAFSILPGLNLILDWQKTYTKNYRNTFNKVIARKFAASPSQYVQIIAE